MDKSPGDSLLFKQSALRGVSYALTFNRYKLKRMSTRMITPEQNDVNRRGIYGPPQAGHRYGIITAIYTYRVFVRFDHQHFSRAVNPAYLTFAHRRAEAVPRSDGPPVLNLDPARGHDRHGAA